MRGSIWGSLAICLTLVACQSRTSAQSQATPQPASTVAQSQPAEQERPAPRVVAQDQSGQPVDFGKLYDQGVVLVFFYPKAGTPGCTAQACSLRDAYEVLSEQGVTVVGVSTDDAASQQKFQEENKLPFVLVADPSGKVLEAFGVGQMGGMASRQAFLIKDGVIKWHDATASTADQAKDVLEVVKTWKS